MNEQKYQYSAAAFGICILFAAVIIWLTILTHG